MLFEMPKYHHPDFTKPEFVNAPDVKSPLQSRMELHRNIITAHPCIRNISKLTEDGFLQRKAAWIPVWFSVMTVIWR